MLNGGEVVTARAKGRNKSLNLKGYAYIGGNKGPSTSRGTPTLEVIKVH